MRDERRKEERSKQGQTNKQTRQSNTAVHVQYRTQGGDSNIRIDSLLEESVVDVARCGLDPLPVNRLHKSDTDRSETNVPTNYMYMS